MIRLGWGVSGSRQLIVRVTLCLFQVISIDGLGLAWVNLDASLEWRVKFSLWQCRGGRWRISELNFEFEY